MPRKDLDEFKDANGNIDYQAYADYLESAECANDEGYDILVDVKSGNIYERTDGDWTKGHGHQNTNNGYNRDKDDPKSNASNHPWKNPWLVYNDIFELSQEELNLMEKPKKLVRK